MTRIRTQYTDRKLYDVAGSILRTRNSIQPATPGNAPLDGPPIPYYWVVLPARFRCTECQFGYGVARPSNGQDSIYCVRCNKWTSWCRPKDASGLPRRSLRRDGATPGVRARVLERAARRCEWCGSPESEQDVLHVAHFVSVADGRDAGLSDDLINSEENLFGACEACNVGAGRRTAHVRMFVAILRARHAAKLHAKGRG